MTGGRVRSPAWAALAVGAALAGCQPAESPIMEPGRDCLGCHNGRGEAPRWTLAGTVYASPDAPMDQGLEGVKIQITDARGKTITLTSNSAGNFYTAERLTPPFQAAVRRNGLERAADMPQDGGCNGCHTYPGGAGAEGRIYAP